MKRSLQQQPSFFSIFMRWVYLLNVGMWNLLTPFFFSIPFFGVVCCSSRSMVCVKSQCVCCDWEPDFEKWDLYYILFIFFYFNSPSLCFSTLFHCHKKYHTTIYQMDYWDPSIYYVCILYFFVVQNLSDL